MARDDEGGCHAASARAAATMCDALVTSVADYDVMVRSVQGARSV